jgi:hypothetical protein
MNYFIQRVQPVMRPASSVRCLESIGVQWEKGRERVIRILAPTIAGRRKRQKETEDQIAADSQGGPS